MSKYLFRFGYCTPAQWSANDAHGWDDESSSSIFVEADSPETALAWGESVAEHFVQELFVAAGRAENMPGWRASRFASWIEDLPRKSFSSDQLEKIPVVRVGEFPDFVVLAGNEFPLLNERFPSEGG